MVRPRGTQVGVRRPGTLAALLVIPFLLLACVWAFSGPPGSVPDEGDHLVKALGAGDLKIGRPGKAPNLHRPPNVVGRIQSTSRTFELPASIVPGIDFAGRFTCFAFHPETTASCQPGSDYGAGATGLTTVNSTVGAYPPFLYVPIGVAASQADTPAGAFLWGRMAVVLMTTALLWLALRHLLRWVGGAAVLIPLAVMTPVVVFVSGGVTLSSVEVVAAMVVSAVAAAALLRPESFDHPASHLTFGIGATALSLSRQMGVVTLGLVFLVLVFGLGWKRVLALVRRPRWSLVVSAAVALAAVVMVVWWERTYDRPVYVDSPVNVDAARTFLGSVIGSLVQSSIGTTGWLDTSLPQPITYIWVMLWVGLVVGCLMAAGRRFVIATCFLTLALVGLAFSVYASVFYPVGAGLQGRHVMPLVAAVLTIAAVGFIGTRDQASSPALRRAVPTVAVLVGIGQFVAVYWNSYRYATGIGGTFWFPPVAQWTPPLGWYVWLVLAAVGAAALTVAAIVVGRVPAAVDSPEAGPPDEDSADTVVDEPVSVH